MTFIKLLAAGIPRVIKGQEGMIFVVDKFTDGISGQIAHVRDYRYDGFYGYAIWSIPADGYEIFFKVKS